LGLLAADATVAEYGSPHGGSWLGLLSDRGLRPVDAGPADIVLDCFGLMHSADQSSALMERAARVRPGGVLLLQFHSLNTIVRHGQWNVLRHGHYAYYSTSALVGMLRTSGFEPWMAWQFDLYGGTVLLAARREADGPVQPDVSLQLLVDDDARVGVSDPDVVSSLQVQARSRCDMLRDWLQSERAAGKTALGYGAASRAVALLVGAGVDRGLLEMVADASPAKQGLRMPGTDIPVANPNELEQRRPDSVLLFVPDLLEEVRTNFPEVEDPGGRWVNADALGAWTPGASASRP
jgi:C-methyltransferase C-terminal domain